MDAREKKPHIRYTNLSSFGAAMIIECLVIKLHVFLRSDVWKNIVNYAHSCAQLYVFNTRKRGYKIIFSYI